MRKRGRVSARTEVEGEEGRGGGEGDEGFAGVDEEVARGREHWCARG